MEKDEAESHTRGKSSGGSPEPLFSDTDAQRIAENLIAVFDRAGRIGIPDTYADRMKCDALTAEYSAVWMAEAIKRTGDAPASARSWRYIEGILRKWRKNGGIDSGMPSDKPKGKTVIEQQYTQRAYDPAVYAGLTPAEIAEAKRYEV